MRDIVRGYWTLLEHGEPGEVYNLCSGRSWLIQEILDFYLRESRVKDIAVKTDPARMRPSAFAYSALIKIVWSSPSAFGATKKIRLCPSSLPSGAISSTGIPIRNFEDFSTGAKI